MCGQLVGLGHDLYRSDFSRISNSSRHDVAMFASARVGEMVGLACGILPVCELANLSVRCSIGAVRAGYAGYIEKMFQQTVGKEGIRCAAAETMAVSAERGTVQALALAERRTGAVCLSGRNVSKVGIDNATVATRADTLRK
jgi:hypothetical protein